MKTPENGNVMLDKRTQERWNLVQSIQVFDSEDVSFLGNLVDVNTAGVLLISDFPLEIGRVYHLQICWDEEIYVDAESVWSDNPPSSHFHSTGFKVLEPTPEACRQIENLIRETGFPS